LYEKDNWRQIALDMLNKHIDDYEIDDDVLQISHDDMKLVATSLLDSVYRDLFFFSNLLLSLS